MADSTARKKSSFVFRIEEERIPLQLKESASLIVMQDEHLLLREVSSDTRRPRASTSYNFWKAWIASLNTDWLKEIASSAVAAISFTLLMVLLHTFDKHPLPNLPYMVTFNSLIAFITAILKASVMMPIAEGISQAKWQWYSTPNLLSDIEKFDSASRGPFGSLLLLFHFKKHFLATMGALLTIFAMAIDPFAQQVVQYTGCLQKAGSLEAQIPRTSLYDLPGMNIGPGQSSINPLMATAMYEGLLSARENVSASLTPVCSSGNCTFPSTEGATYQSTAMCYKRQDISAFILNDTATTGSWNSSSWSFNLPSSNITVKNSVVMSNKIMNYSDDNDSRTLTTRYNAQDHVDMVATVETLMYVQAKVFGGYVPMATRCSLFPCLKTYSGNVSHNLLQEEEIDSVPLHHTNMDTFSMPTNRTLHNGTWHPCFSTQNATENSTMAIYWVKLPIRRDLRAHEIPMFLITLKTVIVSRSSYWNIRDQMSYFFNDSNLSSSHGPGFGTGDLWSQNLYVNGKANMTWVNTYFVGLKNSMTAHMRSHGAYDSSVWARGKVELFQTCIMVRWPWLTLPGALLGLAMAFLAATIVSDRMQDTQGARSYKQTGPLNSSALALIFHNLDSELQEEIGQPVGTAQMAVIGKQLSVQLRQSPETGNWVFTRG